VPRQARLDTPGTLHHVIVRGIEQRQIVTDEEDRKNFVNRMRRLSLETGTAIYAWALMSNYAHFLLRSGPSGLSTYMRRFLTGYAVFYNRRYHRHGHLFQNRFKSIVVEEGLYFKELVRYIHLHPLKAKMVDSITKLDRYPWCGHSIILGRLENDWQDREYVLKWFGEREDKAKRAYRRFVKNGIDQGHCPDMVGGGLERSQGRWGAVKDVIWQGMRDKSDERILGSDKFVQQLIQQSDEERKKQFYGRDNQKIGMDYIRKECKKEDVNIRALQAGSRRRKVSKVRALLIEKLVDELGWSLVETGRQLGVSSSAVAKTLTRKKDKNS